MFARTELRWIQDEVRSRRLRRCQRYNQKINDSGDNSSGRPKGFLLKNALDVCGSIYNSAADAPAVRRLCRRRGRGEPLQYVLGNQPFGPLEILCKRGVLIPRQETEAYTYHLASIILKCLPDILDLSSHQRGLFSGSKHCHHPLPLRILDLCTGTGCIPLLLAHLLLSGSSSSSPLNVEVAGIDISALAVSLARKNYTHNKAFFLPYTTSTSSLPHPPPPMSQHALFKFEKFDIFSSDLSCFLSTLFKRCDGVAAQRISFSTSSSIKIDILTANPPYISRSNFWRTTARSVRGWEPELALVPQAEAWIDDISKAKRTEDIFYERIISLVRDEVVNPLVILLEVGDMEQAIRVAKIMLDEIEDRKIREIEIWRDFPNANKLDKREKAVLVATRKGEMMVDVQGVGHGRAVYLRLNDCV